MKGWGWQLVNDHIENSNKHNLARFSPSDILYVDERFGRWYGLVGGWISPGPPHYVHMYHNPYYG